VLTGLWGLLLVSSLLLSGDSSTMSANITTKTPLLSWQPPPPLLLLLLLLLWGVVHTCDPTLLAYSNLQKLLLKLQSIQAHVPDMRWLSVNCCMGTKASLSRLPLHPVCCLCSLTQARLHVAA
jgi:hypothetical protein